jgi:hypothetical protein
MEIDIMYKIFLTGLLCSVSISSFAGSRMPQPDPPTTIHVEIAKGFNTIQCQEYPTQQQKLAEMQKQLKAINIQTYTARVESDGRMYPSVCGGQMGHLAVFKISEKDLERSLKLGYNRYP